MPQAHEDSPCVCSGVSYKAEPLNCMNEFRILFMEGLASRRFHAATAARNLRWTPLRAPTILLASWLTRGVRVPVPGSKPMCFHIPCQPSVTFSVCHVSVGSSIPGPRPGSTGPGLGICIVTNTTGMPPHPGQEPLLSEHPRQ